MEIKSHHTINIPQTNNYYYLPKELKHCTPKEAIIFTKLFLLWQSKKIDFETFKIQMCCKILKIKISKKPHKLNTENIFYNIYKISELVNSFFNFENEKLSLKLNLVENPLPFIKIFLKKIFGPSARFSNTTFGQYEDASNLHQLFNFTNDNKFLYQLLATYYCKNYNKNHTEKIAKKLNKTIPLEQAYLFLLFFQSTQEYITSSKVLWEGQTIDLSILFANNYKSTSTIPGLGTKAIAFQIAESGVFGNLKELRAAPLWEVLLRLYDIHKRHLDEKRESENNTEQK